MQRRSCWLLLSFWSL